MQLIDVAGGQLEVQKLPGRAAAVPLVLLHEGLGSVSTWREFPKDVADATARSVVVYSRHGYGRSSVVKAPRDAAYMHREALDVLPALLERLGVRAPVLLGHSDGASIALIHAGAGHPVSGLVVMAPHVFVEPETIEGIEAARAAFAGSDLRAKLSRYHRDPDATFHGWNDVWLSDAFRDWNIEEYLSRITAPVLVVQGTADPYGTVAQVEAIERGVSGPVERLVLEGCGHAPHHEQPGEVLDAVVAFTERLAV